LAKLPKSEHEEKRIKRFHERYQLPLAAAIALLLTELFFPERKRNENSKLQAPSANPERFRGRETSSAKPQGSFARKSNFGAWSLVLGAWCLQLVRPGFAHASTSSAFREYKAGKYDQALKEYELLLARGGNDPRLHFNAGAAAYRERRYDEAAKEFKEALTSSDLKMQAVAYYNHGNTLFRLGEAMPDISKRTEAWEKALKDYESSLQLNGADQDAKFNHEFVKKKLEELKQQQQQQNQPNNIQPGEEAKKAKAEADRAVARREYAKALEIMETQLSKDPTTQAYSDYIQRLKEVNGVQENVKH
jgi:Ca-activated chloride channel family protein